MKHLPILVCLLIVSACKTSEQQTSSSDTTVVDSITHVTGVSVQSSTAEVIESPAAAEAPVGPDFEPEKMEVPDIPEDNPESATINPDLSGIDTLYNILARKELVQAGSPTVSIITNQLLDLRNPNNTSLLAVFVEVQTDQDNAIDRTLAVFDSQLKLLTYRFPESDFQTTEKDARVVEAKAITLQDGRDAIELVYMSDGQFDVVSYGSLHRSYIYAFDNNRLIRIFEYQPKSYDFEGADGWISKTVTDEMTTENCSLGKLCDIVIMSKTLNESGDGAGESVPPTIARYTFNGQVYVRK